MLLCSCKHSVHCRQLQLQQSTESHKLYLEEGGNSATGSVPPTSTFKSSFICGMFSLKDD